MWRRILSNGNISILDHVAVILPTFGLSAGPRFGQVSYMPSDDFNLTAAPPPVTYDLPGGMALLALLQEPAKPDAIVLGGTRAGSATLWRLNLLDGTFERLDQYARPGPMVFGRHGELYLHSGRTLLRLDVDTTPPTVRNTLVGIDTPAAMTYDEALNAVLFLTHDRTRIAVTRSDDLGGFSYLDTRLPGGLDLGEGEVSMFVSPVDGSIWIATDAGDVVYQLFLDAAGRLTLGDRVTDESISAPRGLKITSRGTLLFTSNGVLRELGKDEDTGEWRPVRDVPFVGRRVREHFVVSRSVSIPAEFSGLPSDANIVPPPVDGKPACAADLDGNGATDFKDFRAFQTLFARDHGKRSTYADFNGDGITNAKDLHAFRTEFSAERKNPDCAPDGHEGHGKGFAFGGHGHSKHR